MTKEFIYIYNVNQAEFYIIDCDIKPCKIGTNGGGKVYFKFIRNETKEPFDKWCKRKSVSIP